MNSYFSRWHLCCLHDLTPGHNTLRKLLCLKALSCICSFPAEESVYKEHYFPRIKEPETQDIHGNVEAVVSKNIEKEGPENVYCVLHSFFLVEKWTITLCTCVQTFPGKLGTSRMPLIQWTKVLLHIWALGICL